uniref:mesotocin receptor-like n=1 Tax=Myxine glutinosa TaxID=7769 RepID=UPI00358DFED0
MLVLNSTSNSTMPPRPNSTDFPPRDLNLALAEVIILAAIFICAFFGNSIMLFVLCCKRKHPSRMHIFMMHLCIADLLVAIFQVFPQFIWDITDLFIASDFVCRLVTYVQVVGMFSSTYMTVGMTVDRYQAVCFPLVTFQGRRARWNIVVGATWLLSLLLSVPQMFVFSRTEVSPGVHTCYANFVGTWGRKAYVMWICITVFVLPTVILVVCQATICHVLWSNMYVKTHHDETGNSNQLMLSRVSNVNSISRAMIKTVKMTIVIVIVYIMCWMPFMVMQLWSIWDPHPPKTMDAAFTICMLLASLNSCTNPWIYMAFSRSLPTWLGCGACSKRRSRSRGPREESMTTSSLNFGSSSWANCESPSL